MANAAIVTAFQASDARAQHASDNPINSPDDAFGPKMKPITLYVVLVFAFSSVFYGLIIASGHVLGGHGRYATGLEWCPAAAALLTCTLFRIDIGTIGWRWPPSPWQILAYATPLLFCLIGYVAVWASGLGGFPNGKTVDSLKAALGIPSLSTSEVIVLWTFLSLTAGTVRSMTGALGEEIGWSGFLSPRLAECYGFTRAAFMTGAVWATWHFPILFFADYYDSTSPVWFSLLCFVIELLGLSVIILWLRLRSGSVWTGALLHASFNLWNQDFFTPLTAPRGAITNYTIDESGFMLPIVISITAYLFWRQRAAVLRAERVTILCREHGPTDSSSNGQHGEVLGAETGRNLRIPGA